MDQLQNRDIGFFKITKDWDWQSKQVLKEKYGQLTLADVNFETGKEFELLTRLVVRLNKSYHEVINILKKLNLVH